MTVLFRTLDGLVAPEKIGDQKVTIGMRWIRPVKLKPPLGFEFAGKEINIGDTYPTRTYEYSGERFKGYYVLNELSQ